MNSPADPRQTQALVWIQNQRSTLNSLGWEVAPESIQPASSDASFRRYFRLQAQRKGLPSHLILMDAPPEKENIQPFITISRLLAQAGVQSPAIWMDDPAQGFLLCDDLGNDTYAQVIASRGHDQQTCRSLYQDAHQALVRFQRFSLEHLNAPTITSLMPYDHGRLMQEMRLFDEWFLAHKTPIRMGEAEREQLFQIYDRIARACLSQPTALVHRDYHSRNLMLTSQNNPGILDFQDAVMGPLTYDLVSLLRDAYVEWPEEVQLDWAIDYWDKARQAQLPVPGDFSDFWRDFEWMGLQRHLKVLGIFTRLSVRDGKDGYLRDIPVVLRYAISVARRYQGLGPLAKLLERCV